MRLRAFLSLLGIVALVAVIYSPSTIGLSAGAGYGGTSPSDISQSGTSQFLAFLRQSGYRVVLVNSTRQEVDALSHSAPGTAYFLIGPDLPLSTSEVRLITDQSQNTPISLLIVEGNATNKALLGSLFGATVNGAAIVDPTSPFKDPRVFPLALRLGSTQTTGVIDIASPIIIHSQSLRPVAATSPLSYDASNSRPGQRTVIAAGLSGGGGRAVLMTDSAPFTNYLFNYTDGAINEKAFVKEIVDWTTTPQPTGANATTTIVFDNYHYASPKSPQFQFGIPLGPLVAFAMKEDVSNIDGYYNSFPAQVQGFFQSFLGVSFPEALARAAMTLLVLMLVYGAVNKWFATEKKGSDNQPVPNIEKFIVAESKMRLDFLKASRSKSFYLASVARLYEVLDEIALKEFGMEVSKLGVKELSPKLGNEGARRAAALFSKLSRAYLYATGRRRFLFPPILRWKSYFSSVTQQAESFLNLVGMTIAEETSKAQLEYALRKH